MSTARRRERRDGFSKHVEFKAVDEERRVAVGGVLVPDKVDLQYDFVRAPMIRQFAEEFMERLQGDGDDGVSGGVMHVVFPDDATSLVENTVLDEERTIGGKSFPAGSWIQGWKFKDDQLWSLVKDGVLSGYSIGASGVEWKMYDRDEVPDDIELSADHPEEEPVWEITAGQIDEVSSVDVPAVPDAQMVSLKAGDLAKGATALTESQKSCEAFLEERGHDEEDAAQLCSFIQRSKTASVDDVQDDPEKSTDDEGFFARIGKAVLGRGSDAGDDREQKAGRTLSESNVQAAMAVHDASLDLIGSEMDVADFKRFSDDSAFDFDIADYGTDSKAADAGGADTKSEMTNDDEVPEWAKNLQESIDENTKRIEEFAKADDDPEEPEKNADGEGDDPEKTADETPEWAKSLQESVEANAENIKAIGEAQGVSQQLGGEGGEDKSSWAKTFGLGGDA